MPKPAAPKPFIGIHLNLLYPQGSERKIYLKFLHWLVTYGRFIIIFVEIIVLGAFGLRFSYDAQLSDLKEGIKKQTQALESYYIEEPRIRLLQKKLEFIKTSYAANPDWRKVLTQISAEMPLTVKLTNFVIDQDPTLATQKVQFKMSAETSSINDLGYFLKNLRENKTLKDVILQNISIEQGKIIFNIAGGVAQ